MKPTQVSSPVRWLTSKDGASVIWLDADGYACAASAEEPAPTDPERYVRQQSAIAQIDLDEWTEVQK